MATNETTTRARKLLDKKIADESSLLARFRGKTRGTSSADEFFSGLVEGAFLVAAADGEMSEDEEATLAETLQLVTGDLYEPEEFIAMINAFEEALEDDGFDARLKTLARTLPDEAARHEVLSVAALIALCDRNLAEAELKSLHAIGAAFGFSREVVDGVVSEAQEAVK